MRIQHLHGLALSRLPLGVACNTCDYRTGDAAKLGARSGNIIEIHQLGNEVQIKRAAG